MFRCSFSGAAGPSHDDFRLTVLFSLVPQVRRPKAAFRSSVMLILRLLRGKPEIVDLQYSRTTVQPARQLFLPLPAGYCHISR